MKLLYCIPSLDSAGGTERVLTNKVNFLVDKGFEVYIVLTEIQKSKPFYELNQKVKVINLNINYKAIEHQNILLKSLMYLYKQYQYRKGLLKVLFTVRPDITTSLLSHEIDFLSIIKDGSVKVAECHFNRNFRLQFVQNNTQNPFKIAIAKWRNRTIGLKVASMDCLVTLTEEDCERWSGVKKKYVIPNSLSFTSNEKSDCSSKKIIAVGRYTKQKGFDILLKIWKNIENKYPDWHLYIYGDGCERETLEHFSAANKLSNVHLEHSVFDVRKILLQGSFSVVPSRFEGFGMVIIEAMECGLPVVAFDCPSGPGEIITDKVDGFLVPLGNISKMKDCILDLINNQSNRRNMGKMAAVKAQKFSSQNIISKWIRLYQALVD